MKSRDRQALCVLPWSALLALLLSLVLGYGTSAHQATPIASEPDEPSSYRMQAASDRDALPQSETPTGTVTRTSSNPMPSQGEVVTFTSTISGTAPANTNLALYNFYGNTELEYRSFEVVSTSNLTIPDMQYVDTSVLVMVEATGAYSATYQWTMEVRSGPGTSITSSSQFQDQFDHFSVSANTTQTVKSYPFTGAITSSSSNPAPGAGELVTLTIDIAGSGNQGDKLAVTTVFPSNQLAVESFRLITSTNLGDPAHLAEPGVNLITGTMLAGGDYSGRFEVDVRVAPSVAEGTIIAIPSDLGEFNGSSVGSFTTTLTVSGAPGGSDPQPTGTVTRTVSNLTPTPGEIVTFTVTISGSAPAGTNLEIDNIYPNMQLEFLGFQVKSSTNLTEPDDQNMDTQVTMSLQQGGSYHAIYETRMLVIAGAGESIVSGSQFQDQAQTFIVLSEVTQTVTAAPGEPEPTATAPPVTPVPVTPDQSVGSDSSGGEGASEAPVSALPSTGNGSGSKADAMLGVLLGAGVLATVAAAVVRRHPSKLH